MIRWWCDWGPCFVLILPTAWVLRVTYLLNGGARYYDNWDHNPFEVGPR